MVLKLYKTAAMICCGGAMLYKYMEKNEIDMKPKFLSLLPGFTASCFARVNPFDVEASIHPWDNDWDKRKHYTTGDKLENEHTVIPKTLKHYLFIRHGDYNTKGVIDEERYLTFQGREQAELTGKRLASLGLNYTKIVQSTMTRARETCGLISQYLPNVQVETTDLLREGSPIPPDPPNRSNEPELKYHSDSLRIESAFRKYVHRPKMTETDEPVEVIVCHANVIRYFVCRAMQFPPEAWLRMSLRHGSITWITVYSDGDVVVRSIGDAGHMPLSNLTR